MRAAIKKLEKTTKTLGRFCEGELLTKIDRLERSGLPIPYRFGGGLLMLQQPSQSQSRPTALDAQGAAAADQRK